MDGIRESKKVRVFMHMVILDEDAPLYGLSVPTICTLSGEDAYALRVVAIRKDKTRKRKRACSIRTHTWENIYCTHKGQTHEVFRFDGQKLFLCDACYKKYLAFAVKDAEATPATPGRKKVVGIVKRYNKKTHIAEIAILTCPRCTSREILTRPSGNFYYCNRCANKWPIDNPKKGGSDVKLQDDMSKM